MGGIGEGDGPAGPATARAPKPEDELAIMEQFGWTEENLAEVAARGRTRNRAAVEVLEWGRERS